MDPADLLAEISVTGTACAARLGGQDEVGFAVDEPVTPASVMKIQVALAVEQGIETGDLDPTEQRILAPGNRTPGPVGVSLLHDEVRMSVRDLVPQMLTISDNAATDELIALVGLGRINLLTSALGMAHTRVADSMRGMLDRMAEEVGFASYEALAAHDPASAGGPTIAELRERLAGSSALDPTRGSYTTASDTVRLLGATWSDTAAAPSACARVRRAMTQQLTRHRIASGFGSDVVVAAKSGGLMGVVRNEAAVVSYPDGQRYCLAVFTRRPPGVTAEPALIDRVIGQVARGLVDQLRE